MTVIIGRTPTAVSKKRRGSGLNRNRTPGYAGFMKRTFRRLLPALLAGLATAGCEMSATSGNGELTVTDGTVTSLHTQQGNLVVDLHPGAVRPEAAP